MSKLLLAAGGGVLPPLYKTFTVLIDTPLELYVGEDGKAFDTFENQAGSGATVIAATGRAEADNNLQFSATQDIGGRNQIVNIDAGVMTKGLYVWVRMSSIDSTSNRILVNTDPLNRSFRIREWSGVTLIADITAGSNFYPVSALSEMMEIEVLSTNKITVMLGASKWTPIDTFSASNNGQRVGLIFDTDFSGVSFISGDVL